MNWNNIFNRQNLWPIIAFAGLLILVLLVALGSWSYSGSKKTVTQVNSTVNDPVVKSAIACSITDPNEIRILNALTSDLMNSGALFTEQLNKANIKAQDSTSGIEALLVQNTQGLRDKYGVDNVKIAFNHRKDCKIPPYVGQFANYGTAEVRINNIGDKAISGSLVVPVGTLDCNSANWMALSVPDVVIACNGI